ncbi:MAG: hypothetical protein SFV15_15880 [Polyangiaceae bacterium]|nr:hypothetical protein [Polyangiaceae bacterium]
MPLTIRHLTSEDTALMQSLLATFGEAFDDPATYRAKPALHQLLVGPWIWY